MFTRARAWSALVALVAGLLVPVLVAQTAQAVTWDNVRDFVEHAVNGPVPECRTSSGEPGWYFNHPDLPPGTCSGMDAGVGPVAGGARLAPEVVKAVSGAVTATGSTLFKQFSSKCLGQNSCLSLGLGSLLAVLGLWQYGGDVGDDVMELFDYLNPNAELPEVGPGFVRGLTWPEGIASYPYLGSAVAVGALAPVESYVGGASLYLRFSATFNGIWTGGAGNNKVAGLAWSTTYHCRVLSTGDIVTHTRFSSITFRQVDGDSAGTTKLGEEQTCAGGSDLVYMFTGKGTTNYTSDTQYEWGALERPALENRGGARLECEDEYGSSYYVETVAPAGSWEVPTPKCLGSDIPVGLEVGPVTPNGLQPETTYDLTPAALTPQPGGPYPECVGAACLYTVKVNGQTCSQGRSDCVRWTQNPEAQCWYGPYQVDRSLCAALERYYEVQAPQVPITRPNIDGDPVTHDGPDPVTDPLPQPTPTGTGPQPTVTVGNPPLVQCSSTAGYNLGPVVPEAVRLADTVGPMFDFDVIGGYRADPIPDHPSGRALDLMTSSTAQGDAAAAYLQHNATALGVNYLIWQQRIWSVERADEGWRLMEDRGSPTQNHMDHIHVTVYSGTMGGDCTGVGGGAPGAGGDACWPSGWGVFNPAEWVLRPTKCALQWAFVPREHVLEAKFAGVASAWADSAPGQWAGAVGDYGAAFSSGSGSCVGPVIHVNDLAGGIGLHAEPLNTCQAGYMRTAAQYTRIALTVGLVVGAAFSVFRFLAQSVGYNVDPGGPV